MGGLSSKNLECRIVNRFLRSLRIRLSQGYGGQAGRNDDRGRLARWLEQSGFGWGVYEKKVKYQRGKGKKGRQKGFHISDLRFQIRSKAGQAKRGIFGKFLWGGGFFGRIEVTKDGLCAHRR